jgi:hypothetical protein
MSQAEYDDAKDRIMRKLPDDRDNIRDLKRVRAQDILLEKKMRREEAGYDRVIAEEDRITREQNRSPVSKFAHLVLHGIGTYMAQPQRAEPPRTRVTRMQRWQPVRQYAPERRHALSMALGMSGLSGNSVQAPGMNAGLKQFSMAMLPRAHSVPDNPHVHEDHLSNFVLSIGIKPGNKTKRKSHRSASEPIAMISQVGMSDQS